MTRIVFILLIFFTIKSFSQTYTADWIKEIPFTVLSQTIDKEENIYLTGYFQHTIQLETNFITSYNSTSDIIITKYDSLGNLIWYKHIGGIQEDEAWDIKIDPKNDLIFTAMFESTLYIENDTIIGNEYFHNSVIAKFTTDGALIWIKIPGYNNNDCFHTFISCIDKSNNILISGNFYNGNAIFPDTIIYCNNNSGYTFLAKYDKDGNFLWVKTWTGSIKHNTTDNSNNIIIIKESDTLGYNNDVIVKCSPDGNIIWQKNIYSKVGDVGPFWQKVATDSLDNIYISTTFSGSFVFDNNYFVSSGLKDIILLKLNSFGNLVYGKTSGAEYNDEVNSLFIYNDKIFITGNFINSIFFGTDSLINVNYNNKTGFIAQYSLDGNFINCKKIYCNNEINSEIISARNSVFLTGFAYDSVKVDNKLLISNKYFLCHLSKYINNTENNINHFFSSIFPNPFKDVIYIKNYNSSIENVELYNFQGNLIMRKICCNSLITLKLNDIANGIYFIIITDKNSTFTKIVEKI